MFYRFPPGLIRTTCAWALSAVGASLWPLWALAQANPQADDPRVAVPAPAYRSALDYTPTGAPTQPSDWRQANAQVGQFTRGHMDILKWEAEQGASAPKTKPAPPPKQGGRP